MAGRPPRPLDALRVPSARQRLTAQATAPSTWTRCTARSGGLYATCVSPPLGTGTFGCSEGGWARVSEKRGGGWEGGRREPGFPPPPTRAAMSGGGRRLRGCDRPTAHTHSTLVGTLSMPALPPLPPVSSRQFEPEPTQAHRPRTEAAVGVSRMRRPLCRDVRPGYVPLCTCGCVPSRHPSLVIVRPPPLAVVWRFTGDIGRSDRRIWHRRSGTDHRDSRAYRFAWTALSVLARHGVSFV